MYERKITAPAFQRLASEMKAIDELLAGYGLPRGLEGVRQLTRNLPRPGECPCGRRSELLDRLGHDGTGHRLYLILARARLTTEEQLRGLDDLSLLDLRLMGVTMMDRLHQRLEHCGKWEGYRDRVR